MSDQQKEKDLSMPGAKLRVCKTIEQKTRIKSDSIVLLLYNTNQVFHIMNGQFVLIFVLICHK